MVRHKLVQRIVAAYGEHAERESTGAAVTIDLTDVPPELRDAVAAALAAAGVADGHLAVEMVDAERIRALNREHRGQDAPTDVLAFPIDGPGPTPGPRELGDVAICPEHCSDVTEAAVHGTLHLCGYDHETDRGEMLALQARVMAGSAMTRAGFIGLAGRPNVGKSTLVNAIVGSQVAIVSVRPQTTRRAIRGVATDVEAGRQLVLVDLPGVQRPRDVLTERMQKRVERELADSDLALLVVNGEEGVGAGRPLHRPRPARGRGEAAGDLRGQQVPTGSGPTSSFPLSPPRLSWRESTRSSRSAPAAARASRR